MLGLTNLQKDRAITLRVLIKEGHASNLPRNGPSCKPDLADP